MSDYIKMTVKLSKEDFKEYLSNYLTEEELEITNLKDEAVEAVNGILQEHFSDFQVYNENSVVCDLDDTWFHPFED